MLGSAAGQAAAIEGAREALSKATFYGTERAIKGAIDCKDNKSGIVITTTELNTNIDLNEIQKRAARHLLNQFYLNMGIYERDGTKKSDIDRVDTCAIEGCDCTDYDDRKQSCASLEGDHEYNCLCGHGWGHHERKGQNGHIIKGFAAIWYQRLGHKDDDGDKKVNLEEIEPCDECSCRDYDFAEEDDGDDCECGHAWCRHDSDDTTEEINTAWILGIVSASYVQYLVDA